MLSEENLKIVVFLRAARAALGWTQTELAEKLEIAKTTLARIETSEMAAKGELVARAIRIFKDHGIAVEPFYDDFIRFSIEPEALSEARSRLENVHMRRSDWRKEKRKNDF